MKGSVLILVVWTVSLLALLIAALGSRGLFALGLVDRLEEQLRVELTLEGGVQFLLAELGRDLTPHMDSRGEIEALLKRWDSMRDPEVTLDPSSAMGDEDRRINLNTAPVDVLEDLFRMGGVKPEDALLLAESIADWRDEDREDRDHGAEGFYYRGLASGYDCKDGPFESVEELLLVRGVTPAIWRTFSPTLTVYGSGKVNVNTAPQEVLTALGFTESGVGCIDSYRAGDDGKPGTEDDSAFPFLGSVISELQSCLPSEDQRRLSDLMREDLLGVGSEAFEVSLTGSLEGAPKSRVSLRCVVDRSGRVLAWREG